MPKLSVIVPVYNTEKYLRECVDSILAQTFEDFELILVNDGSTDGSGAICDEYAAKDARIQVIHQQNGGITVARKSGVRVAQGEYVTFVDSDDWIEREMYATMLECGKEAAPDVVICGMLMETSKGIVPRKEIIKAGFYDKNRMQKELYPIMLFDFAHCMPAIAPSLCNKLFRRQLLECVIIPVNDTITYGEDALCTYACLLDAESICVVEKTLYHYRNHAESVSNGYSFSLLEKFSLLIAELRCQFQEREYDLENQLSGYIARHSLECIRNELLYHTGVTFKEKKERINRFVDDLLLTKAIRYAILRIKDQKTIIKMVLVRNKMVGVLYLLYLSRDGLIRKLHGGSKI